VVAGFPEYIIIGNNSILPVFIVSIDIVRINIIIARTIFLDQSIIIFSVNLYHHVGIKTRISISEVGGLIV
jgi:hypothetical protein